MSDQPWWRPGVEMPRMFWTPVISPSSLVFYTGDTFPQWRGNLFVGALTAQRCSASSFVVPVAAAGRGNSGSRCWSNSACACATCSRGRMGTCTSRRRRSGKTDGALLRLEPTD